MPAEVLTRRPDVRQAEQALAAADANIGAARAAFFPRITLTGSLGTDQQPAGQPVQEHRRGALRRRWCSRCSTPAATAPTWPSARAQRDAATAQYEKAIQSAFRDVADALAGRATLAEQRTAQAAQVDAEARRLALAEERYKCRCIASSLDVLDAQRSLFAAQQALVQVQSLRAQNLVAVYRVLGGGV